MQRKLIHFVAEHPVRTLYLKPSIAIHAYCYLTPRNKHNSLLKRMADSYDRACQEEKLGHSSQ